MLVKITRPFSFNGKYYNFGDQVESDDLRVSPKYYQVIGFNPVIKQVAPNQPEIVSLRASSHKRKRK